MSGSVWVSERVLDPVAPVGPGVGVGTGVGVGLGVGAGTGVVLPRQRANASRLKGQRRAIHDAHGIKQTRRRRSRERRRWP